MIHCIVKKICFEIHVVIWNSQNLNSRLLMLDWCLDAAAKAIGML